MMAVAPPSSSILVDNVKVNNVISSIDATFNGAGFFPVNARQLSGYTYWGVSVNGITFNRYEEESIISQYKAQGWDDVRFIWNETRTNVTIRFIENY